MAQLVRIARWRPMPEGSALEKKRRLGMLTMFLDTLLMYFGYSVLVPLVAVHFAALPGFTAASVGIVLAIRQMSQQGLDLMGGMIADRAGARLAIATGCFIRAGGFLVMGFAASMPLLIAGAIISGLGGAFFDAATTASLAELAPPEGRQRAYAIAATMSSIGLLLGPVAGVALLRMSWVAVGIGAAAIFALTGIVTAALLPADTMRRAHPVLLEAANAPDHPASALHTLRLLAHDRVFLLLTVLTSGYWFLQAQLNITVPLASARLGGPRMVAVAYAIYAGSAILLQYPAMRYFGSRFSARIVLVATVALAGLGLGLTAGASAIVTLVAGVTLFSLASLLINPMINWVTAELAPKGQLGAYFGFGALAVAIGGGAGQVAGGMLYDLAARLHQPLVLAGTLALVGLVSAAGLLRLRLNVGHVGTHAAPELESASAAEAVLMGEVSEPA